MSLENYMNLGKRMIRRIQEHDTRIQTCEEDGVWGYEILILGGGGSPAPVIICSPEDAKYDNEEIARGRAESLLEAIRDYELPEKS